MFRSIAVAMLVLAPTLAHADKQAADACAGSLSPGAKMIFDASAPEFPSAPDPKGLVKSKTKELVLGGKIQRGDARANAISAGECLKKLR
jgi:hypothetical protein